MAIFGRRSRQRLENVHPDLVRVLNAAIKIVDFTIIFGYRSEEEQARLYARGRTVPGDVVTWAPPGRSKHNREPSEAVDIAPWPIDWEDTWRFGFVAGVIQLKADELGIRVRFLPEKGDYGHVEIVLD